MSPLLIDFLRHIESELRYVEDKTANLDYDDFVGDETLSKAIVRSFEIIGEACKLIPEEIRTKYPLFDWKGFAGLRDRMIHHYWGIDYQILWDAIKNEVPFNRIWISLIIEREQ